MTSNPLSAHLWISILFTRLVSHLFISRSILVRISHPSIPNQRHRNRNSKTPNPLSTDGLLLVGSCGSARGIFHRLYWHVCWNRMEGHGRDGGERDRKRGPISNMARDEDPRNSAHRCAFMNASFHPSLLPTPSTPLPSFLSILLY